jgi:hypothetical protein
MLAKTGIPWIILIIVFSVEAVIKGPILFLGDSNTRLWWLIPNTTLATVIPNPIRDLRFTTLVSESLKVTTINRGSDGKFTRDFLTAGSQYGSWINDAAEIGIICFGHNHVSNPSQAQKDSFETETRSLIALVKNKGMKPVLMTQVSSDYPGHGSINPALRESVYAALYQKIAADLNLTVIDFFAYTQQKITEFTSGDVASISVNNSNYQKWDLHIRNSGYPENPMYLDNRNDAGKDMNWFSNLHLNPYGSKLASEIIIKTLAGQDTPGFTSSQKVTAQAGSAFGYKVKYNNPLGGSATITYQKKPAWLTALGDTLYGTAPNETRVDSVVATLSVGGKVYDTLRLSITLAYYRLLEAETGTLTAPMAVVTDPNASGGSCISAPAGTNTITRKIEASYIINNMLAGTYFIWLKIYLPTGSISNNFGAYAGFGTTLSTNFLKPKVENAYTWVRSTATFPLTAGTNTLILGHGLALAKIDQIVITTSLDSTLPAGLKVTSIQEKQNKKQKLNLNGLNIVPRTLSGGRINFVVNGIGAGDFAMDVFNITGSRVWSFHKQNAIASAHQVIWDGTDSQFKPVRSGIYVARIQAGNQSKQVMALLNR